MDTNTSEIDSEVKPEDFVEIKSVYSPSEHVLYNKIFYSSYVEAGTWPHDGIEVSDEDAQLFCGSNEPIGKRVGMENGTLCWVDRPVYQPTLEELVAQAEQVKLSARKKADDEISWLQDAVDSGKATEGEVAKLSFWRNYRIEVMRLDTSKPPIVLPPDKD